MAHFMSLYAGYDDTAVSQVTTYYYYNHAHPGARATAVLPILLILPNVLPKATLAGFLAGLKIFGRIFSRIFGRIIIFNFTINIT